MIKHTMRHIFAAVLLIAFLMVSFERNNVWLNDGTMWSDAILKSPMKSRGYNEIGLHAVQARDYALAISAFTKALQLNPYLQQAYINIGLAYEGLHQTDMAILAYEKAVSVVPEDPIAYYNMGLLYYNTKNDRDTALKLFLKARDLNPSEPDVHYYLNLLYRDMGKTEQSLEEFQRYTELK